MNRLPHLLCIFAVTVAMLVVSVRDCTSASTTADLSSLSLIEVVVEPGDTWVTCCALPNVW